MREIESLPQSPDRSSSLEPLATVRPSLVSVQDAFTTEGLSGHSCNAERSGTHPQTKETVESVKGNLFLNFNFDYIDRIQIDLEFASTDLTNGQ
jgi:hypothetical protein